MNKQLIGLLALFSIMLLTDAFLLIFKKRWGKGLIAILICGSIPIAIIIPNAILFPSYFLLNIVYILIGVWFWFFVLFQSLKIQGNIVLLTQKSFLYSVRNTCAAQWWLCNTFNDRGEGLY